MSSLVGRLSGDAQPSGLLRRVRRGAAPAAKRLLFNIGAFDALRRISPSRGLAILRYHAVCGADGHLYADPGICITPEAFERHVKYLGSHYRVLPLTEAVRYLHDGKTLPPNAVAITFDDGYADNLPAARVLNRYGVNGTFYITAGCLSGESPFWPSEIRQLVARVSVPSIRLRASGTDVAIPCGTAAEKRAAIKTLGKLFKSNPIRVRERLREELRDIAGVGETRSFMLTWDELREMRGLGMTIGAHTVTHPNLPSAGAQDARLEITGSRARLEEELGARVTMFSYPNGGAERYMTRQIAQMVKDAGFEAATTSWNGFAGPGSNLYALERVQIQDEIPDLAFALEVERFVFRPAGRRAQAD